MRKYIAIIALSVASILPASLAAQSAVDAMNLSQQQLRGTARFMAMGGAFTALGGDLSTLTQNPGGIGIYRSSEIGLTLDVEMMSSSTMTQNLEESYNNSKLYCNNFGYIGAVRTGSDLMPYFNWGVSYSRTANFNRSYRGTIPTLNGSLTNYIAGFTTAEGWPSQEIMDQTGYNPYWDSSAPWMSIMAYNSYLINTPTPFVEGAANNEYVGLWQNRTSGSGSFDVRESGSVDEYSIDFGGNFSDIVYWGVGFGIDDIKFNQNIYYTEDLTDALIATADAKGVVTGNGGFGLESIKRINGTGFNFKAGLIIRPINEFRIGLAVHTPTYYSLTQQGWANVDYGFSTGYSDTYSTDEGYASRIDWRLKSPWRLMAGVAGVIGGKAIISADYEYRPYQDMSVKMRNGGGVVTYVNGDITDYYQATNILRLGAEYRLNRNWSIRAGYSFESTPTTTEVRDGKMPVYTSGVADFGTTPSYELNKATQYASCGIGYRYNNFYLDATYAYRHRSSEFHPFTPNDYTATPPSSEVTENFNNIVLSLGFRF